MCVEGRPTQPEQAPGTGPSPHSPVQLPLPRLRAINTEKQLTKTTKKREGPKGAGGEGGGGEGSSPAEPLLTRRALCIRKGGQGASAATLDAGAPGVLSGRRGWVGAKAAPPSTRDPTWARCMGAGPRRQAGGPRPQRGGPGPRCCPANPPWPRAPLSAGGSAQESWKVETTNSCT